ncbi:hypothetical protein ACIBI9_65885 [Nonomuraea sp. NPDC050451]|uniref:hypothetical protein n=1 Tax=Nonomuraea sp. NPDC050451 TaxID=3364364 RepID=UPI0037A6D4BD
MLRQLVPLARQAALLIESQRLQQLGGPEAELARARLGLVNPVAVDELQALTDRLTCFAAELSAAAWPDWDSPERRMQRAIGLMPDPEDVAHLADQLRTLLAPSLALAPVPQALRLQALADQISARPGLCAAPGCQAQLATAVTGRPRRFCNAACRQRARRARNVPAGVPDGGHGGDVDQTPVGPVDPSDQDVAGAAWLAELLQALPAETRPLPSVAPYDQLLARRPSPGKSGRAGDVIPPPFGHDWGDTCVTLLREDGWWSLHSPHASLGVPGFGPHGTITARGVTAAQRAAAAAVTRLTGRQVLGWTRQEHGRTLRDTSSWSARLGALPS